MTAHQTTSEQQQATILHAVISGFDKLSETMESGEISKLMNQCFEVVESVITLWDGKINKFMGDAYMATFGIADDPEGAPAKATGAALELLNKITELNSNIELSIPIEIKVGIKTGSVLLGNVGKDDKTSMTVIGNTVSIAGRLSDIAQKGQVLTGLKTYENIKDKYQCQALEPVPVKGIKKPLSVFQVMGRKKSSVSISTQTGRMISSAMVGREEESRQLEKQFIQLINGRGSIVNIIGKAGIGKSRLMAEIRHKDLLKKVTFFEGRAVSNGKNLSFHPITQIIRSWAGIKEEDSPDDSLNKLQRGIQRVYAEAFDEIFPFIATMMGYRIEGKAKERTKDIEGEALENLILKNLRDLISRAASIRPVVIVIEDAHWCDISSVIFLESLFKLAPKHRIMFVNVFRPGHKETGERIRKFLGENLKAHSLEIKIEPLEQKESEELIQNLLHQTNLPVEINNLIIERAAGNPFFIEEVIRSLIDEGLIEIKDNNFLLTKNIIYANIPESIDNVILSRIDRLDEKTKSLLKTASVIGRNFYFKVLEEAAETIEEMDNKLEYLKDVQLLNERKKKDEVEFLFKHALAQQATYESIVEKTRKELHFKIAGSIEKVFAGRIHEFYGMLALHYGKAGHQGKTEEYLIKAGEESMKSGACAEAVTFLKKALETHIQINKDIPDRQKVVELEEKLAFALYFSGQFVEAIEYFDKLIAYYYKPFPESTLGRLIGLAYNLIIIYRAIYFYKVKPTARPGKIQYKITKMNTSKNQALINVDPKKAFFDALYTVRFMRRKQFGIFDANLLLSGSSVLFFTGIFFNLGQKLAEWGKTFLDEKNILGWLWGKYSLMMYFYFAGKRIEIKDEEKVFKYGIKLGEYWPLTIFYVYSGFNMIELGNEKLTVNYLNRIAEISEAFDNNFSTVQYHRLNVIFNLKYRKLEETIKATEEANHWIQKSDHAITLFVVNCFRSMALSLQQNLSMAKNSLHEAEKLLKDIKTRLSLSYYFFAKSYIEIAELKEKTNDRSDGKIALKTTGNLIHHSQKVRKSLTEAYRLRAIVFWLLNKPNKALKNFNKSIKAALSYGGNLELSRTYFEVGKFLRDPNNKKERINGMNGTEYLMKAKGMFEEMGLEWDLKEYERFVND
jgi:predicted ATPase/class 3 adenylate cyclase